MNRTGTDIGGDPKGVVWDISIPIARTMSCTVCGKQPSSGGAENSVAHNTNKRALEEISWPDRHYA